MVALQQVTERRYAAGSSFEPQFTIVEWVPRAEDFGAVKGPLPRRRAQERAGAMDDEIPF